MNKWQSKLLPWIFVSLLLLAGCNGLQLNLEKVNQEEASTEQEITLSDCIPLEDILVLCHRDGGGAYRYMDPIPAEYWNLKDETTGVKGIATKFDGKMYKLYANGKVIDEAGNVKEQMPQNPDDEVDIFTAWVLVLREDDMLGYDAIYNNMSYDIENAITVDELRNLIHVVQISEENFDEYFTFIEVEEQIEITGSKFEENHLYAPYKTLRLAYKGPGYLMRSGSFEWTLDVAVSVVERSRWEKYDNSGNKTDSYEAEPEEIDAEIEIEDYDFDYVEDGDYRNVCDTGTWFHVFNPLEKYDTDPEHSYTTKHEYSYENLNIKNAQGYLIYCEDIPEEFWNVTEKGYRYICVKREDMPAWRFSEYGRIGSEETDVDKFMEQDITDTDDGQPKEKYGDILSINGNDLSNFIGIKLESLQGF